MDISRNRYVSNSKALNESSFFVESRDDPSLRELRYTTPLRLFPVHCFPDFIFCASPTSSAISPLYVSESCCKESLVCSRCVRRFEVFAVSVLRSARCRSRTASGWIFKFSAVDRNSVVIQGQLLNLCLPVSNANNALIRSISKLGPGPNCATEEFCREGCGVPGRVE